MGVSATRVWSVPPTLLQRPLRFRAGDSLCYDRHRRGERRDEQRTRASGRMCVDTIVVMVHDGTLGADEAHGARAPPADLHPVRGRLP